LRPVKATWFQSQRRPSATPEPLACPGINRHFWGNFQGVNAGDVRNLPNDGRFVEALDFGSYLADLFVTAFRVLARMTCPPPVRLRERWRGRCPAKRR
jgi:hypothetical protein